MELLPANDQVFRYWLLCHRYGRDGANGTLRLGDLLGLAGSAGISLQMVEQILGFEEVVLPILKKKAKPQEKPDG